MHWSLLVAKCPSSVSKIFHVGQKLSWHWRSALPLWERNLRLEGDNNAGLHEYSCILKASRRVKSRTGTGLGNTRGPRRCSLLGTRTFTTVPCRSFTIVSSWHPLCSPRRGRRVYRRGVPVMSPMEWRKGVHLFQGKDSLVQSALAVLGSCYMRRKKNQYQRNLFFSAYQWFKNY